MSETKEQDRKKPLRLSRPGRLELNKTVETGQVRQSFSHGRTKTVTVEVKKKRTFARGEGGRMKEVKHDATAPASEETPTTVAPTTAETHGLTAEERAARARAAMQSGMADAEGEVAESVVTPADEAIDEAASPLAELEDVPADALVPAPTEADGESGDVRRRQDEEAKRLAEDELGVKLNRDVVRSRPAAPATPEPPAAVEKEEAGEDARRARRGRGDARRPSPSPKRTEPRRRAGKMTVVEALSDDGGERMRSLAAVRRAREKEKQRAKEARQEARKVIREVVVPEAITVQELANRMAERGGDVIKALMKMDVMATINQTIDADTAELLVAEFGHRVRRTAEADVEIGLQGEPDVAESMVPRAPVVTVMGHVDHGKTSLLDALRETDVAGREAGGITQHIGAYQVTLGSGDKITFLDTPGHEAFTEMRARGAKVTDIVVLVVAADDGIQPQTVEAINHAKAAEVPIIVAVNKIDRPDADTTKVRNELLQHELVPEEMGGDVLCVDVSAKEKTNLDKLEETILLQAEVLELGANPDRDAQGIVVEAKLERGRGSVATVLVQRGVLEVGDIFIAGAEWGRVRALIDDRGQKVDSAGPSVPVEVLGLNGTPSAGDDFAVVENEGRAREITEFRARQIKKAEVAAGARGTAEQIWTQIAEGKAEELPVVIKADVQGSLEAIIGAAQKISTDEVSVAVLHSGVGGINESDIALAKASGALMVGFNVRANPQARELATQSSQEIRYYSVIYDIIDDLKALLSGMLAPTIRENFLGNAEIRDVFNITKVGRVAGCMITQGVVRRGAKVRLLRDNVVIHEGSLSTLKRFKEEVKEVREGYECGMSFENYGDIKVGDVIECFEVEEIARTL